MHSETRASESDLARGARRAYELGRLRTSALRAGLLACALGAVAAVVVGRVAIAWLPVTFGAWMIAHWRGAEVLRGARYGLLAGAAALVLPLSLLRPCCATMPIAQMTSACCEPVHCVVPGVVIGLTIALLVPRGGSWWRTGLGLALGAGSVATFRCASLFAAEAIGLLVGIAAGLLAASVAAAVASTKLSRHGA